MISKKRESGVLLNISSLKGEYPIGTFGDEVKNFANYIKTMGFHYWQTLPITAIGLFNSPYASVSAFAGNFLYISPDLMFRDGYIAFEALEESKYYQQIYKVDYEQARISKRRVLEIAYASREYKSELDAYIEKEGKWIIDYATYMSIKESYNLQPWWEWPEELKYRKDKAIHDFVDAHLDRFYFYIFEQYIFDKQWQEQLQEIHKTGIKVIGDMPMYVAHDSVDVWANTQNFQMDENLSLRNVAGVPPDFFSADGQFWGNPLYDFDHMKKNNYEWWTDRIARMFHLYDVLRIDHFRAFSDYWSIPAGAKSAKEGCWIKGPGMDLISTINEKFTSHKIIAEDLGTIDDAVRKLLLESRYPGMKVLQFAFSDFESTHLPHNYPINTVAYTGTHDNNTTLGWVYAMDESTREYMFEYLQIDRTNWAVGGYASKTVKEIIRAIIKSNAHLAVIPYQDLCGYGADTRMNTPGVANSNWEFRLTQESYDNIDKEFYLRINNLYGRNNEVEEVE